MKKTIISLAISLIYLWIWYSQTYNFSHFPAWNLSYWETSSNWFSVLQYRWNSSLDKTNVSISEIENVIRNIWEIWFMKYSYYWRNEFRNKHDNNIDLRNLDREKLEYPVLAITNRNNFIIFIHSNNLSNNQKNIIWNRYQSEKWFIINKYWNNWYILRQTSASESQRVYYYKDYFKTLKDLRWDSLANFQVWQNPYQNYRISDFSDNILQVWIVQNWQLRWLILDLQKRMPWIEQWWSKYWQEFQRDESIMKKIVDLYYNVRNYRRTMWGLPQDLWSLHPNFIDITRFNRYYHDLKFERTNNLCYKAWFKPKSEDFKRLFSQEINWWYWETEVCY